MSVTNKPGVEQLQQQYAVDEDEIDLQQLFYTLMDNKWLIAAITAFFSALGLVYALLATPVYESNILVQVESGSGGMGKNLISEASALFDVKTDAAAEIEILKSRMIAAKPVDALGLNITAQPKYFPIIGKGIARLNDGLSQPGLLGFGGYAWGKEATVIRDFKIPASRTGHTFRLMAGSDGAYILSDPLSDKSFKGRVGQYLELSFAETGRYGILVEQLNARPGAQFKINVRSRLQQIESLQTNLKVSEKGKASGVISVGLQGTDPSLIANILNTVAQEYLRQNIERKSEEAENSLQFLSKQLPELKKELDAAENEYNNYRNQRGTIDLGEEAKNLLAQATSSQAKMAELKQRKQELMIRYLPDHPSIQAVDAALRQAQAEAERVNALIKRLPLVEQDAVRLTRDMKVSTDLYASLLQTMQQLRLVKAGKVGTVRLIDDAVIPEKPIAPKKSMIVALATLLGLLVACAVVLLRRAMKGAIESVEQLEELTHLPVYATVPHSPTQELITEQLEHKRKTELLARSTSNDPAIESLRSFLTAIQFATLGARNNILLITGPTPGVGKSFIAANFAAVVATSGKKVLLIDGDIRKGYLHKYFGVGQGNGFSELIAGTTGLKDAVHKNIISQVDFMACGIYPPNPTELLRHPKVKDFLDEQAHFYDMIIIDAAPVLPVSDAAILGSLAGSSVMVIREGQNTAHEVSAAQKRLGQSGIEINGLVLNDLKPGKTRYKYGYAYQYGYGQNDQKPSKGYFSRMKKWFK